MAWTEYSTLTAPQAPRSVPDPHAPGLPKANLPFDAQEVVSFWTAAGPDMWFAKDRALDLAFHDRFIAQHEVAARGELNRWVATAQGTLALVLVLDQFPRNAFRGTPKEAVYPISGGYSG